MGFTAADRASEVPCPGLELYIRVKAEEATAAVLKGVPRGTRANYRRRTRILARNTEKLRQACNASGEFVCEVAAENNGTRYLLSRYRRVRDVRLVHVPPHPGGPVWRDSYITSWLNWRSISDYAFLRAYVGADGQGVAHHKANRPLETEVHLQLSPHGVRKGSLVLALGFPASTFRHQAPHAVVENYEHVHPAKLSLLNYLHQEMSRQNAAKKTARRKHSRLLERLKRWLEDARRDQERYQRWGVRERKRAAQAKLLSGLNQARRKEAVALLKEMSAIDQRARRHTRRRLALEWLIMSPDAMEMAHRIVSWSLKEARRKGDRYLERTARIADSRDPDISTSSSDKALLASLLRWSRALPLAQRPRSLGVLDRMVSRETRKANARGTKLVGDWAEQAAELLYSHSTLISQDTNKGNNGGPVLDDRGRLVGLVLHRTPEGDFTDWQYRYNHLGTVVLDIRVIRRLAEVMGARSLLRELSPPGQAQVRKLNKARR